MKKFLFFCFVVLVAFLFKESEASIVLINDTPAGASYASPNGEDDTQSSQSTSSETSQTSGTDEVASTPTRGGAKGGTRGGDALPENTPAESGDNPDEDGDGEPEEEDSDEDCETSFGWNDCEGEFSASCTAYQITGLSFTNLKNCNCMNSGDNLDICDGTVFGMHSLFDFNNYARVKGFAFDFDNMTPISDYISTAWNYYYHNNPEGFCPYLMHITMHEGGIWPDDIGLYALSSNYYNNTSAEMNCTSSSVVDLMYDIDAGIHCIKPGFDNITREIDTNICVYNMSDYQSYEEYDAAVQRLTSCTLKADYRQSARSLYALSGQSDDLSSRSQILHDYYLYRPEYTSDDYEISECYVNCSTSEAAYNDDASDYLAPYCQGWNYVWKCNSLRGKYENDNDYSQYHVSSLTTNYAIASNNATWVERCMDNGNEKYFAVCGLKTSKKSEAQCQAENATCQGASGEATCGGDTYCTSCTCSEQFLTLAQWCSANGIADAFCDDDHYEGVHDDDSTTDVCTVDGDPKYLAYQLKNTSSTTCPQQNRTNAIESGSLTSAYLTQKYGSGAVIEQCWDNSENVIKWHISCQSDIYSAMCHVAPGSAVSYCVYGRNPNVNMKTEADGTSPIQYCQTPSAPGICSQSVTRLDFNGNPVVDQASATLKIYEVSSPEQCYNQYGKAAVAQICIYPAGSNAPGGTHYNCFYDLSEFIYSTTNKNGAIACAVRHDLSGDYILYKGQKRWSQCACPSVYSYNQYAGCSAGVLGGNPCVQDLSNVNASPYLKSKWISILGGDTSSALDGNGNIAISSVTLYPYCVCDPSYKYNCDGERETGVGGDCMGKYQSCTCDADPVPDNWTNDYFACQEGFSPTGVWKDNGCGQKVWECSNAVNCTPEHKYTCDGAGQKGVDGQGCQDSTGAYVRYKACECMSGYTHTCTGSGQTGVGDACILGEDEPKYQSCECPDGYSKCGSDNTMPASGATACTVEPEEGSAYTVYSECSCPSGWSDCNSDGQEGDDSDPNYVCQYGGTTLYKYCRCPSDLQDCSNPDDTDSYPPIPEVGDRAYVGVESGNYRQCKLPNIAWEEYRYEKCKCNEDIFTVCRGNGASGIGATCQTPNDQYPLYSACVCNGDYTTTCPAEEGKSVAIDRAYDYCQIGEGEKLYKPEDCVCNVSGWTTCSDNGQVGNGTPCLVGASTSTNLPKYASCSCSSEYNLTCDGAGQWGSSATCTNTSGETFYSACSCNTGWVTCTSTQSGVGEPCLENNVEHYEACQCKEDYKYTCSGSAYTFPTDTSDVCVLAGVSYFTSCNCASGYTKKCDANGEVPTSPNDYCERDGEKFYAACECDRAYNKTCLYSEHLYPKDDNDYCIDANDPNTRKYKDCVCESGYNQSCTSPGEVPPTYITGVAENFDYNAGVCVLNGVNYYTTCKCASGMSRCLGNLGEGDESWAVCRSGGRKNASGEWTTPGKKYYQRCRCDPQEFQVCNELAGEGAIAGTTVGSNTCEAFESTLNKNSQQVWQVSSSEIKTASSDCACKNYYAADTVITAVSGRNHQLKALSNGYTFDTASTKCLGFSTAVSGSEHSYTAYQAETDDPSWFDCYPPSRAICARDGTDCVVKTGYTRSRNGCECPPWYSNSCGSYEILDNEYWREDGGFHYYHPNPGWAKGYAYDHSSVNSWASQCTKLPTATGHSSPTKLFSVWAENVGLYLAYPQRYVLPAVLASAATCNNLTIRDKYNDVKNYFDDNPNIYLYNPSWGTSYYRKTGCYSGSSYIPEGNACQNSFYCGYNHNDHDCRGMSWHTGYTDVLNNTCRQDSVDLLNDSGWVCIDDQQNNIDFVQINYVIYTDDSTYMSDGGWDGNFGRVCTSINPSNPDNVQWDFNYRGPSGSGVSIARYFTSYSATNQSSYIDVNGVQQTCSLSGGRRQVKEHYCGTYLNVESGLATPYVYNTSGHYYPTCTAQGAGGSGSLPQCIFTVGQMSSVNGYSSDANNHENNCIADQWIKAHWNHLQYATGPNKDIKVSGWTSD